MSLNWRWHVSCQQRFGDAQAHDTFPVFDETLALGKVEHGFAGQNQRNDREG